jgi:hypothetical protein
MSMNPMNKSVTQLKAIFYRALAKDNYNKLIHFVVVDHIIEPMPGRYVVYKFYKKTSAKANNRIAIATDCADIKDWLTLHSMVKKSTKNSVHFTQSKRHGCCKLKVNAEVGQHSDQIQDEIMRLLESGETMANISRSMGCTVPNLYYHRKRYKERMAKQLEVDKT